jgi:type VI secretion system protein
MTLRLEIISQQRDGLGNQGQREFGPSGGRIGRAADNDWVLPDPRRYLSSHHAQIVCRGNEYFVLDVSSNGLFFGREREPIGTGGERRLQDGDTLRLGNYVLRVAVPTAAPKPPPDATMEMPRPAAPRRATPVRPAAAEEEDFINLDQIAVAPTAGVPRPVDEAIWPGLELDDLFQLPSDPPAAPSAAAATAAAATPAPAAGTPRYRADVAPGLLRPPAPPQPFGQPPGGPVAPRPPGAALAALCRGAGIDDQRLPGEAEERILGLAGRLLRETILGLQDLDRAQAEFRRRHDIEAEPDGDRSSPALGTVSASDYLQRLLRAHDDHELDAVLQLRRAFAGATRQELLIGPALQQALQVFMLYIAPGGLELRTRGRSDAERWALHCDLYRTLVQAPEGQLPAMFLEAFAQAYKSSSQG